MKKEYLILAAIIILLGGYLFIHDVDRSQYELPPTPKVAAKDVTKLEIEKEGNTIVLLRDADDWLIGDKKHPADAETVKQILAVIENFKLTALVSASKAYTRYDLSDDKRISVKVYAGDVLKRAFDIGKQAETYQHTFVKLSGDPNVYHAQKNFKRTFEVTVDSLRDKKVFSLSPATINTISVKTADGDITLGRKEVSPEEETSAISPEDGKQGHEEDAAEADSETDKDKAKTVLVWQDAAGNTVEEDAVADFLSKLSDLKCESYIDDKTKADFEAPNQTITLTGDQTYTLSIFEKVASDNKFPAVSSQNDYPFLLSKSLVDQITNRMDKLHPEKKDS